MPQSTIVDCFFHTTPCFHVRVTSDHVDLEKTFNRFKDFVPFLIVSQEGLNAAVRRHQHILLGTDKLAKKDIKDIILELYPQAIGNAGHSIKHARNKQCLVQYTLKEGNFKVQGFTNDFIARAIKLSYDHKGDKQRFVEILNQVIVGDITYTDYARAYWRLKATSGQPMYRHHMQAHLTTVAHRVGELDSDESADRMVFNILNPI